MSLRAETARQHRLEALARRCAIVYLASTSPAGLASLGWSVRSASAASAAFAGAGYRVVIGHVGLPPADHRRLQARSDLPLDFRRAGNVSAWARPPCSGGTLSTRWATCTTRWRLTSAGCSGGQGRAARDIQYGHAGVGSSCGNGTQLRALAESYFELNGVRPRGETLWAELGAWAPGFMPALERSKCSTSASSAPTRAFRTERSSLLPTAASLYVAPEKVQTYDAAFPSRG